MNAIDTRIVKICAFCKYWYDPTNQHIKPKNPMSGIWYFDKNAKSQCMLNSTKKRSDSGCNKFDKKV